MAKFKMAVNLIVKSISNSILNNGMLNLLCSALYNTIGINNVESIDTLEQGYYWGTEQDTLSDKVQGYRYRYRLEFS